MNHSVKKNLKFLHKPNGTIKIIWKNKNELHLFKRIFIILFLIFWLKSSWKFIEKITENNINSFLELKDLISVNLYGYIIVFLVNFVFLIVATFFILAFIFFACTLLKLIIGTGKSTITLSQNKFFYDKGRELFKEQSSEPQNEIDILLNSLKSKDLITIIIYFIKQYLLELKIMVMGEIPFFYKKNEIQMVKLDNVNKMNNLQLLLITNTKKIIIGNELNQEQKKLVLQAINQWLNNNTI